MPDTEIVAIRALLTSRPRPVGADERRQRLDEFGRALGQPDDARLTPIAIGDVPAEWSTTPQADAHRAVLYLHGGGYMAGSIVSHRYIAVEIGRAARARTLALGYRLAPEHPYPAQLDDALAAYQHLREQGLAPEAIAVGGDSAGGNLVLSLLLALRDRGLPLPACGWLISPWTDLTASGATMESKTSVDLAALSTGTGAGVCRRHRVHGPADLATVRRPRRTAAASDPGGIRRDLAR